MVGTGGLKDPNLTGGVSSRYDWLEEGLSVDREWTIAEQSRGNDLRLEGWRAKCQVQSEVKIAPTRHGDPRRAHDHTS